MGKRSTRVGIRTETIASDRVSAILAETLGFWDDGEPILSSERNYLMDAAAYWLETQGNKVRRIE